MIRRLVLQNWRAYEKVSLNLEAGTTFVVASNGIGKSSLIEGATWALYGDAAGRPSDAIRLGSASATASVELLLPDGQILTVSRQLSRRLSRNAQPPVSATLDRTPIDESKLSAVLRDSLGGDPAFLARVTMVRGAEWLDPDSRKLNLQEHLARYFGADGLRQIIVELQQRIKENDHRIHQTRQITSTTPKRHSELLVELQSAEEALKQAEYAHEAALKAARSAEQQQRQADAYQEWLVGERVKQAQLTELGHQVGKRLGESVDTGNLGQVLDHAEDDATGELDNIRRRRSELEGLLAGIRSSLEKLRSADALCPVCRRPLSAEDAARATNEHEDDIATITKQIASLTDEAALSALVDLRLFKSKLLTLGPGVQEPPKPAMASADTEAELASMRGAADAAMVNLIERRSAVIAASARLRDADSDARGRELLEKQYRDQALLTAAEKSAEATLVALLNGTIKPLAQEITSQWKRLFADRGPINMNSQGELSRLVNDEVLEFASFSTGEKMGAQLLLRLLVLDTATRATFCWVDEPLEHLDPDTRRQMALRLALTPTISSASQMLITTYEEQLVRRIAEYLPGRVRVLYVRTGNSQ
jgi:DNA repair exonuclease SbcCD ATPase subunit